jgi:6-pyruvoyltetrahydropterin/6-carboxytetrahydropterin synthase
MYQIRIIAHFSAAHQLRHFKGKCEALHGHNWKVEVEVASPDLDQAGLVMDFGELKAATYQVLEGLDHRFLNEIPFFTEFNPSSEHIARYIYQALKETIPRLTGVTVWESENSVATYRE